MRRSARSSIALIFAARQSSPGSSTVVFTVSLSVRFAANTLSSVNAHTVERQETKPVIRVHTFTRTLFDMQEEKRNHGFTGLRAELDPVQNRGYLVLSESQLMY